MFSSGAGRLSTGGSSCPVMSSYEKSPSCMNRSPRSLTCSVMCSWAASSSSVNGRTWGPWLFDFRTTVCNPIHGERVADHYTRVPNTAGWSFCCIRLHGSKTREVVQRAVRPFSVSLRGARLVSIEVSNPMPGLPVGQCVS